MQSGRSFAIAIAVLAVLWFAFDSKWVSSDPTMPSPSLSLGMLAVVFSVGAWVMQAGTALGCAAYVALHALGVVP